jgi:hypothetical protein
MTVRHSTEGHGHARTHRIIYLVAAVIFVAAAVVAVVLFRHDQADAQAREKARQLQARFTAAGLPLPADQDDLARMFRTDGGAVCADPDSALRKARWNQELSNGAAGPGQRPVISDDDIARADTLIIDTYCPDQLPGFLSKVRNLKLDDTG